MTDDALGQPSAEPTGTFLQLSKNAGSSLALWHKPALDQAILRIQDVREDEGITGVIVEVAHHTLLPYTYLDDQELAALRAEVDEYNTDPAAGWAKLLSGLAERRTSVDAAKLNETAMVGMAASRRLNTEHPFTLLSVHVHECIETSARYRAVVSTTVDAVRVLAQSDGEHSIVLFEGQPGFDLAALAVEVSRFNNDPERSLNTLLIHALRESYQKRARAAALLAREQLRTAEKIAELTGGRKGSGFL